MHWIPLGAGGPWVVRATGSGFALLMGRAPYHAALTAELDGERWAIEVAPSPDTETASRGVVATGPVGCRFAGRWRVFRYEVRCWRGGRIPDLAYAVKSHRVTTDPATVRRVLELVPAVPPPTWTLTHNSNTMVAWVLARAGLARGVAPPHGGCAPGWRAGLRETTDELRGPPRTNRL